MKRILLIVAMLLSATSAMAAVTVTATDSGGLDGVVTVAYTGDVNVRAFALDISVDNGATIDSISGFKTGTSDVTTSKGYGIFPGRFRDYIDASAPNWSDVNYTPVAPVADPDGNDTGLGGNYITVELGTLYADDINRPNQAGTLFTLGISCAPYDCNLVMTANATRGGVVGDDGDAVTGLTLVGTKVICAEAACITTGHVDHADFIAAGSPECWCYPGQCHGDADGLTEGKSPLIYQVGTVDLTILQNAWLMTTAQVVANPPAACADFDRREEGKSPLIYRVGTADLTILQNNWLSNPTLDCDPGNRTP